MVYIIKLTTEQSLIIAIIFYKSKYPTMRQNVTYAIIFWSYRILRDRDLNPYFYNANDPNPP